MSINDYAAHNARKAPPPMPAPRPLPIEPLKPADPIGVQESELTDTFVGKLKRFWGGL